MLVILIVTAIIHVESVKKSPEEIQIILAEQKQAMESMAAGRPLNQNLPDVWPPKMNDEYPNLALIDQNGQSFDMDSLKGKIIIVEYLDFSSAVSQAQSGSGLLGVYGDENLEADSYAIPFQDVLRKNNVDIDLSSNDVLQVKIVLYAAAGDQASRDDAVNWAEHFNLTKEDGIIVATPEKDIRDKDSSFMVGGYQLLDRNLRLRADSSGGAPKHNLDLTFVPLFEKLVKN